MTSDKDTPLTLRAATMADLSAVDALLARAYPRLIKKDYPPSVLVTALPVISRAQPALLKTGTYYVVLQGQDVVGAGGWTRDRKDTRLGHVRHVVSDDRLQRRGIGRLLLEHIFATAHQAGIREMECWSTRTAERFYNAMGFSTLGPLDVTLQGGITFPSIRMRRPLG